MKRKLSLACKKAKENVNMDCLSVIEGEGKVREFFNFLMSGNPEKVK